MFFNEHAPLSSISEWRALTPASLTGVLVLASIGLAALLAKHSPNKWNLFEIGLLVLFGLATLPAIRMLAWNCGDFGRFQRGQPTRGSGTGTRPFREFFFALDSNGPD